MDTNCPICKKVLIRPKESKCGHPICEPHTESDHPITCPICQTYQIVWKDSYTIKRLCDSIIRTCSVSECDFSGTYEEVCRHQLEHLPISNFVTKDCLDNIVDLRHIIHIKRNNSIGKYIGLTAKMTENQIHKAIGVIIIDANDLLKTKNTSFLLDCFTVITKHWNELLCVTICNDENYEQLHFNVPKLYTFRNLNDPSI